jgi:hypothetical protein
MARETVAPFPECYAMAITRSDVQRLLDAVPDETLDEARRALEPLADPFLLALASAPIDDEPETDAERVAIAEAHDDISAGRVRDWTDVRRELGGG